MTELQEVQQKAFELFKTRTAEYESIISKLLGYKERGIWDKGSQEVLNNTRDEYYNFWYQSSKLFYDIPTPADKYILND
jgi:hypothetical protein